CFLMRRLPRLGCFHLTCLRNVFRLELTSFLSGGRTLASLCIVEAIFYPEILSIKPTLSPFVSRLSFHSVQSTQLLSSPSPRGYGKMGDAHQHLEVLRSLCIRL